MSKRIRISYEIEIPKHCEGATHVAVDKFGEPRLYWAKPHVAADLWPAWEADFTKDNEGSVEVVDWEKQIYEVPE